MTDNTHDQRRGSTTAVWLVVALLLSPVVYVLSLGPAMWLIRRGYPQELVIPYLPLKYVADACPPIRNILDWYVSFWE